MTFSHATCELCKRVFTFVDSCKYFKLRNGGLVPIECKQQPLAEVIAVCLTCTVIVGSQSPIPHTVEQE